MKFKENFIKAVLQKQHVYPPEITAGKTNNITTR